MRVDAFDFDLPKERIARRPAVPRHSARLLDMTQTPVPTSVTENLFHDRTVSDLPNLLRAGDVMVFNDTRVIPARLMGIRATSPAQKVEEPSRRHASKSPSTKRLSPNMVGLCQRCQENNPWKLPGIF